MKPDEAIRWAGSQKELAAICGVTESAVSQWATAGAIPLGRQYQLELISTGAVKVDPELRRRNSEAA